MALLTIPSSPAKAAFQNYELNTTDLIALVSDNYFKDPVNWQRVVLTYQSSVSNQISLISFVPGVSTTITAPGYFSAEARDLFEVSSISIYDKQNGRYRLEKNQIPDVANYTIDLTPLPSSLWDVFLAPTIATAGNGELHREGGGNGDFNNSAYYSNSVTGDFVFSGEVQTFATLSDFMIGYRRTIPQAGLGYNSLFNTAIYGSQNMMFASVTKLAGTGDTATTAGSTLVTSGAYLFSIVRVSGVITAKFNNVTMFTDNNSDPVYLVATLGNITGVINSATLVETPVTTILAGAYSPASTGAMQNITSTSPAEGQSFVLANPASVTSVKVMISKNAGGSPLTGTLNMTLKASDYLGSGAEVVSSNTLDLSTLAQSLPIPDGGVVCEFLFASPVSLPAGTNSIKYNYAGLNVNGTSIYISVWGYSPTITDGIAYSYGGPIPHVDFWFQIIGN
jgi:hypothetical protein